MEVSALVLACGLRVGADERYKIWCCIGNPLALHYASEAKCFTVPSSAEGWS